MKRFTVPCIFGKVKSPFHIYIGEPLKKHHPLKYQSAWLASERGGVIPNEVMESFEKLYNIAMENNVVFEELTVYALGNNPESFKHDEN